MNNPKDQGRQSNQQQEATNANLKNIKISIDALSSQIDAQRREQKERKEEDHKWPRKTAIAAIAYTVVTLIMLIVSGYQTYLIRSNNVISQRALVSVDYTPIIARGTDIKTKEPTVFVTIPLINSGNTATTQIVLIPAGIAMNGQLHGQHNCADEECPER